MATMLSVIMALIVLFSSINQLRDVHRRGVKVQWAKALVTVAGCVTIALAAIGTLIVAKSLGHFDAGVLVVLVVVIGGIVALIVGVNRCRTRRDNA
jgi:hypothetical protein